MIKYSIKILFAIKKLPNYLKKINLCKNCDIQNVMNSFEVKLFTC